MGRLAIVALLLAACSSPDSSGAPDAASPTATLSSSPRGTAARVIRVIDGDSLLVSIASAETEVRLIGVNAPEGSECLGDAARSRLEQILDAGDVTLVADGDDTDQYGRLLRYVFVGDENVNLALLAEGAALVLQGDYEAEDEFVAASDAAADSGLGMWSPDACGATSPLPDVAIADYVYNPPGRDEDGIDDEWVAFVNRGANPVAMTGGILRDESTQNRYVFPRFSLAAGSRVVVRSGCGADTTTDLYWCAGGPVWSNGGDTVILQLPDGTVVARDRYAGDF